MKTLLLICLALTAGCTVTRIRTAGDNGLHTSVSTYTIAWPWLDTTKSLDNAKLSTSTNAQTLDLAGMRESEVTSTNAAALFNSVIGTAVSAAVKAAK
jgi:hypothetical protein